MVYPLHGVQRLEGRVLHWILNVGKSVESKELRGLGKLCTSVVQIGLEVNLLGFELLLISRSVVLIVWMEDVDYKVEVQVELKLFGEEISSEHLSWD